MENQENNNCEISATSQKTTFRPSEVLSYMFTDKKFMPKAISLYLINLISLILLSGMHSAAQNHQQPSLTVVICWFAGYLILILLSGYIISCIKSLTLQENEYNLPYIEPMNNFISGLQFAIANALLIIPFALIIIVFFTLPMYLKIITGLVLLFFIFKYIWVGISFYWVFAHKNYWTVFFKYKLGKEIISKSKYRYAKGVLYLIAFGILTNIITFALAFFGTLLFQDNSIIANIFIALNATYFLLVIAFIFAKMINPECVNLFNKKSTFLK